jgi:hypothetical protein
MDSVKNSSRVAHDLNVGYGREPRLRYERRRKGGFPGHRSGAALEVQLMIRVHDQSDGRRQLSA